MRLPARSTPKLAVEGGLDPLHRIEIGRIPGATRHLLRIDVLDVGLDPPDVAPGVTHPPDAVPKEELGHLGDGGASGLQGSAVHGIAVFDIKAEKAQCIGPLFLRGPCAPHPWELHLTF